MIPDANPIAQDSVVATREDEEPLIAQIRALIANSLLRGNPNIGPVAKKLGMSTRHLQRRLRMHGADFRQLGEETGRKIALRHLARISTELTKIACLLAYSELTAFVFSRRPARNRG